MFYQVYSPNRKGMLMRTGAPPNYKQKYNLPKRTGQEDNARERQTSTTCNRTTSSWTEANKSLRRPNNQSQWAHGQPTQRVHQPTLMDFYHQLLRQRATSLQEKISRSCVYKKKAVTGATGAAEDNTHCMDGASGNHGASASSTTPRVMAR